MQIFLMRHGIAGPAPRGMPDSQRVLTAEGRRQVQAVVRRVAHLLPTPAILSSPYKRALETAEILSRELGLSREILTSPALVPESAPADAWRDTMIYRDLDSLVLVGHQPLFSALTAYILGFPDLAIDFPASTLVCVDVPLLGLRPRGVLRWMLTPKLAAA
jgi:phosphohistidine phosphatase